MLNVSKAIVAINTLLMCSYAYANSPDAAFVALCGAVGVSSVVALLICRSYLGRSPHHSKGKRIVIGFLLFVVAFLLLYIVLGAVLYVFLEAGF